MDNHSILCLLPGFCSAGGAAPPRAPASSAAGRSLVPASPTDYLDADVYQSPNAQE